MGALLPIRREQWEVACVITTHVRHGDKWVATELIHVACEDGWRPAATIGGEKPKKKLFTSVLAAVAFIESIKAKWPPAFIRSAHGNARKEWQNVRLLREQATRMLRAGIDAGSYI